MITPRQIDASRYRSEDEVNEHWKKEPVLRLKNYLSAKGDWDDTKDKALLADCTEKVEAAVEEYLKIQPQDGESMFDYMFKELPMDLQRQRRQFLAQSNKGE